jgi:hypothetical protein
MLPATRKSAPNAISHGKTRGAPVEANEAVLEAPVPVFPVLPEDGPEVSVAVATGVTDPGIVVVVVVVVDVDDPGGVVVVVVVVVAAVKLTVTLSAVKSRASVVSVAVYVTDSTVVSLTANVATPLLLVVAEVAVTFEDPPPALRATAFPATGSPLSS